MDKISSHINNYKTRYGIELDREKVFDTYSLVQWYRWTFLEKTPSGKYLYQLPSFLITPENVGEIARYAIAEILGFKTKEQQFGLRQRHLNQCKIGFSKTDFVLNSPINILRLAYPEYNLNEWDLHYVGLNKWKDYSFFLEVTKHYYYNVLSDLERSNLDLSFSPIFIESKFLRLLRAKEIYYSHLLWGDILLDIEIHHSFKYENKISYDGILLNSKEEAMVYNFVHNDLNIKSLKSVGLKHGKYTFFYEYDNVKTKIIPDFIIERENERTVIIEYYGLYAENPKPSKTMLVEYKNKTKIKNKFFTENDEYAFIALYPNDLKYNFNGVREKLTPFMSA